MCISGNLNVGATRSGIIIEDLEFDNDPGEWWDWKEGESRELYRSLEKLFAYSLARLAKPH